MGIINQERLLEIAENGSEPSRSYLAGELLAALGVYNNGYGAWRGHDNNTVAEVRRVIAHPSPGLRVNRESALALYEQLKARTVRVGFFGGKNMRPWQIDDQLFDSLDNTQPWWGFEFECGFRTSEQRSEVINHVWDTWDGVTFDGEGEGNYMSEITFVPSELSTYNDGTAPALQFMQYISNNRFGQRSNIPHVGTHLNFSLPEFRDPARPRPTNRVVRALNTTLAMIPVTDQSGTNLRNRLFGRANLYGGFYDHSNYIEGKLFRTTYEIDQFRNYLNTSQVITKCAQALVQLPVRAADQRHYIANFVAMCDDETVSPEVWITEMSDAYYHINGGAFSAEQLAQHCRPSDRGGAQAA